MNFPTSDLILTNARVITLDARRPRARTVGIQGGRILFLSDEEWPGKGSSPEVLDCGDHTVLPGFIDAHGHLAAYARSLVIPDLGPVAGIRSIEDIKKALRLALGSVPAGWIRARGYDEFHLRENRHPTRYDLDQAVPNRPVKISHRSGQAHVLNSPGLTLAGISITTPDPPGGIIDRDAGTGEPTGLLFGMGKFLAERVPPPGEAEYEEGVKRANNNLLQAGVTSFQDASRHNSERTWRMFARWKMDGLPKPRVKMHLGYEDLSAWEEKGFPSCLPEPELSMGGVKIMIQETTGKILPEQAELNEMVFKIHSLGLQAVIHAVEEGHIEAACLAVEKALQKKPRQDHRHRIEHCSLCPPALAARLYSLGIMVVTQPAFLHYSGERYLETVPADQLGHLYPLATLTRAGINVAGSSDFPVTPPSPLLGMQAAVSRLSQKGRSILPEEGIQALQALELFTINGALSSFEEKEKGSLTPGKLADLVVLSDNPLCPTVGNTGAIKVIMTIIDGKIAWQSEAGG